MSGGRIEYQFAVLRVVPHVDRGEFVNVGVVLHSRTAGFLGIRAVTNAAELRRMVPEVDGELLARYLACYERICEGDLAGGELALLSPPERFHWMTSPRSDLIQSSPVHEGVAGDPAAALDELFSRFVRRPAD
ncbi:MAG TPA: DUF3037 domain-containing protein [Longimicrobiales bacterium]|nr:DUF3037 domain-containing protein [Longimicrobiales bacterium]